MEYVILALLNVFALLVLYMGHCVVRKQAFTFKIPERVTQELNPRPPSPLTTTLLSNHLTW
ncbi:hypothetical protein PanWU01x14_239330 [Parasponia andersonii]|uniref:Uncharacterized protein n=1 Tax=Parasponia andersonii TaxID=3476 RepID=A0A2P5BH80_PARAD|nr:hypothetical protein PanWU01x14_239330 [Parasponia andersonii]